MRSRLVIHTTAWWCLTGALLFAGAGTLRWAAAWIYLAEMEVISLMLGAWLARHDPALLDERMKFPVRRKQPGWDRVLMSIFMLLFLGWLALMGVDAKRLAWWPMPVWAQAAGAVGIALCNVVTWQVFKVNSFAAPVVRLQSERRQKVVTTGLYAHVRHPMYAGALFFIFGTPLLLGSWLGLIAACLLVLLLALRIFKEEAMLRQELDGYEEYARRVRWRLVPFVW
jgi:protein-S-isoprenylcysteine O-methyltransferase Ste14